MYVCKYIIYILFCSNACPIATDQNRFSGPCWCPRRSWEWSQLQGGRCQNGRSFGGKQLIFAYLSEIFEWYPCTIYIIYIYNIYIYIIYIYIIYIVHGYNIYTSVGVAASHIYELNLVVLDVWWALKYVALSPMQISYVAKRTPTRALPWMFWRVWRNCSGLCLVDTFDVCCNGWQFGMCWATWQIPLSKSVLSICRLNIHDWARYLVDLGADAGALSMQQEIKSMIS